MAGRLQFFPGALTASRDLYKKNVPDIELGTVEYFMQEREVASLCLLLKIQGEGFLSSAFSWKNDVNLLSWFPLTAHAKQMQKYQVYVFCSSGKLLI